MSIVSQLTTADVYGSDASRVQNGKRPPGLLCVANFPANTGFAWEFIESLYAGVADRLAPRGVRTWVAYPAVEEAPRSLARSAAEAVALETRLNAVRCVDATLRFIRANNIKAVYLADRAAWHPAYLAMRLAGVRRIVVHDHTSGARTRPRGVKRLAKLVSRRSCPPMLADVVIGVSDYVAQRKREVDLVPAGRVRRIWNSVPLPARDPEARRRLRREFGLPDEALVVVCACRAAPEKGVDHLLRAFDRIQLENGQPAVLLYMGDGPYMEQLKRMRSELKAPERVVFAGYRTDAVELVGGADVAAIPSVWAEAFGLAALEPMARGVPVVATRAGGIPEVVVEGETGLLVEPGDETALSVALTRLLSDAAERGRLGENGRRRAEAHFSLDREIDELAALFEPAFAHANQLATE